MTDVELIFPEEFDEELVRARLADEESGFLIEEDLTLRSALVDGFTIAGVVINAVGLATALLSLKAQYAQNAKHKSAEPEIRIRRSLQSTSQTLPNGSVQTAVQVIEEVVSSGR